MSEIILQLRQQCSMGPKSGKIAKGQEKGESRDAELPKGPTRRQKFKKESVFDDDNREVLQDDQGLEFIGLLRGKFKSKQATLIGTGAIIGEDLVLTAAHNVCQINPKLFKKYKEYLQSTLTSSLSITSTVDTSKSMSLEETISEFKHVEFVEWMQFYPGINGSIAGLSTMQDTIFRRNVEGNYWKVKQYKVHPNYIMEPAYKRYDLCLLQLQRPVKGEKIKLLENYTNTNTEISVYGYPKDRCFVEQHTAIHVKQLGAKGRFKLDTETGFINYKIATEIGQSGSPIFINTLNNGKIEHFCIGIHNGGNKELSTNVGIHLNEEKLKFIAEAEETFTGKLSKIATAKVPKLPENSIPTLPPKDLSQKSLQQYESQISIAEQQLSNNASPPKKTIYLYREAAALCLSREIYGKAITYYEKFIELMEAMGEERNEDDEDQWQVALINLAKSYCEAGDYQRSLALYEQTEDKCRQLFSLSVEKESVILNNKGAVLVHLHRYEEALTFFTQSYHLRRAKFGQESLSTYNSLENVASMKLKLALNLSQTIADYEKVLKFKERKFGVGSKEAMRTRVNLSFALFETKRYADALECFYFCLQKLRVYGDKEYEAFVKQFTRSMRELCRTDCSLDHLKYGFQLCQKYGLEVLGKELDDEWGKRKALESTE